MQKPKALDMPVFKWGPVPTDAEVEAAVERAVRRAVGGAPRVGVFLSGGVDSSLLLALARREADVVAFTIAASAEHPDLVAAVRLAAEWGIEHHALVPGAGVVDEARAAIARRPVLYPGDEAVWLICQAAFARHVDLVLATDGIDELAGGYWWHANPSGRFPNQNQAAAFGCFWAQLWRAHLEPLLLSAETVGLELRFPYLDPELVEVLSRVPFHFRAGEGETKRQWRRVAARHVPAWVVERPKLGFCDALQQGK